MIAGKIGDELAEFAEQITEAGVPATLDPRDLQVPGVWIIPRTLNANRLGGKAITATLALILITADAPDSITVLNDLGGMLDKLAGIIPGIDSGDINTVTVHLPNISPDPMNALQVSLTVEIEKRNLQ